MHAAKGDVGHPAHRAVACRDEGGVDGTAEAGSTSTSRRFWFACMRGTEIFVRRNGRWAHTGWHLDTVGS